MNFGFSKQLFYDWMGSNEWLFSQINSLDGNPVYDSLMVFLSNLAEHNNFPYFFAAMAIYAGVSFFARKTTKKGGTGKNLVVWIGVLSVFATSFVADGLVVKNLKDYFSYPRPYVELGSQDVTVLGEKKAGDGHYSFPSGHVSFITVVVCSLWPVLSGKMPLFGLLLIFAVCWSRIASGMHFPADVLGGFSISLLVVLIVRFVLYTLFAKLFKWKC